MLLVFADENLIDLSALGPLRNHTVPPVPVILVRERCDEPAIAMALKLGATRCLRKPFRPTTLLSVIDECLSAAEPHRRYVATLAAVASAVSEPQEKMRSSAG